jgi:hypothetical protein
VHFTDELNAWVARQRWYAGKSHEPSFRILDTQAVPGATRYLLMDDAGSLPALYQVPIARVETPPEGDTVIHHDDDGYLIDATRHPEFTNGLLAEMGVDTGRITGSRVFTGEQSNTSIVFDEDGHPTIILKLFRTLHHGENPDVTVQRALSNAGSPYVPRFFGNRRSFSPARRTAGPSLSKRRATDETSPTPPEIWARPSPACTVRSAQHSTPSMSRPPMSQLRVSPGAGACGLPQPKCLRSPNAWT